MVTRIVKIFLVVLIVLISVTGCWDAVDIDRRDICTAIFLDKQGEDYVLYAEIAQITSKAQNQQNGQGGGQQQQPGSVSVRASGKSITTARLNLDRELDKPLYLGAVQSLIITERMAEFGIEEYVMRLRQLIEYRKTLDVIVTPDEPEEFLGVTTENETSVGFAIEDTIENLRKEGVSYHMSLADMLQKHSSKNPCYLLNMMSGKTGQIFPIGSMVMDRGKKIGFIPNEESRGTVYFAKKNKKIKFEYEVDIDGTKVTVEAALKGRSIKPRYKGDKAAFTVSDKFDVRIQYPADNITITPEIMQRIGAEMKGLLTKEIEGTIEKSQKEFKCDYLSFSEDFRIAYPDIYNQKNWEELFENAEFDINVTVNMLESIDIDYKHIPNA